MSFGYSVGDFVLLAQLAWNVVQGARQACGAHDALTREVTSLHIVLRQLEREVAKPQSILNSENDDRNLELETLANHCQKSLKVLSNILDKYNGLSEEKRRVTKFWKRIQFGNGEMQDLSKLRLELSTHTNVITLFLNLLSVGSLGKVEEQMTTHGEELRAVRRSVNWVTASLQASAGHGEGSILTSYKDDDKVFWKDFRRKMVKEGHTSRMVRKYETLIMNYVKELGQRGALDELLPLGDSSMEDPGQDNSGVMQTESSRLQEPPTVQDHPLPPPNQKPDVQTHSSAASIISGPATVNEVHSSSPSEPPRAKETVDSALLLAASLQSSVRSATQDFFQTSSIEVSESLTHVRQVDIDVTEAPKAPMAAVPRETERRSGPEKENISSEITSGLAVLQDPPTSFPTPSRLYRPPYVTDESDMDDDQIAQDFPKDIVQAEVHEHEIDFSDLLYEKESIDQRQTPPPMPVQQGKKAREILPDQLEGMRDESQNGAQIAVNGTCRNLVVQDRSTFPTAPQAPSLKPTRPAQSSADKRPPAPTSRRDTSGENGLHLARACIQSARANPGRRPPLVAPLRMATESDARRYRIPPGYKLKEWNPDEEPIRLLGTIFDYFSLGQWIYHFTVFYKGATTPIGHMAGELWTLLIRWHMAMGAAEEAEPLIELPANVEIVTDFLASGDRIEDALKKLLRACEGPMLEGGRSALRKKGEIRLNKNAGAEFVESLFGLDRQLKATEQWMASVRLWIFRFKANCNPILRHPGLRAGP